MAKYKTANRAKVVGRTAELQIIDNIISSSNSELLAIIGRRRVGKTFLIKHGFEKQICFHYTGKKDVTKQEQITTFCNKISSYSKTIVKTIPNNWEDAFELLKKLIAKKKTTTKKAIFIDELPWIATPRSGFLSSFSYFWNDWAVNNNIIVIICGSAASWMIEKIVNNKGGLHNRITRHIKLKPFTLTETEAYLKSKKINYPRYEILQLYMAMGGIPYYLKEIQAGDSAIQAIDKICFSAQGILRNEFHNLYSSLFDNYENHEKVIRALASKRRGLTRNELLKSTKLKSGGGLTRILTELQESSFIARYPSFGKTERSSLYRLVDEYSSFYLSFIEKNKSNSKNIWLQLSQTPRYKAWAGYAFEGVVIKHVDQLKTALGIEGIYSEQSTYLIKSTKNREGFQIDLLIDRNDNAINICEMKFYNSELSLTKKQTEQIRKRRDSFRQQTKTKKLLINTVVTTYGFITNGNSIGIIDNHLDMNSLFS